MRTEVTRPKYERAGQRYASDLTDMEWGVIEPWMPTRKRLGRPRETDLQAVMNAILYILRSGCQWRMLPKDFPPFTTVQGYFYEWVRRESRVCDCPAMSSGWTRRRCFCQHQGG
jgi:transposase